MVTKMHPSGQVAKFFLIGIVAAMLSFGVVAFTPLHWFSVKVTDGLLRYYRPPQHPHLLIVAIDDTSLKALGRFPFDRTVYAQMLERLKRAGADVVVFDLLFVEPTPSDAALAAAMRQFGKVVLGVNLSIEGKWAIPQRLLLSPPFPLPLSVPSVMLPPKPLLDACAGIGFVYPFPSQDGVCRTLPLAVQLPQGKALPSLALIAAMVWKGQPTFHPRALTWQQSRISLGADWDIPVLPPYSPNSVGFPHLSLLRVLKGDFDPDVFKGKLVLVGIMASGLTDRLPTPTDPLAFGVEIHASAINALLTGHSPRYAPFAAQLFVAIALALLVGLAGLTQRYRPCLWAFLLSAVAAYGLPMLLVAHGLIVPPFPLLLSVLTAFIAVMVVLLETHWAALQRLQAFVAPSVTGEAMSTPGRFRVGERREVTVLFSDIRNFTPIAASLPPYEVVALLSSYFNRMTELVQLYGGIVDKFLGDGMMVLFGVLPHQDDHAQRAVLCAWQMLEELGTVNWEWERVTGTPLRIGIGINTGTAVIGEIGSEQRKELTALGASVNLAQRLEQLTKDVGASLLISESTYERVAHLVTAEPLEPLTVRGFDQPICVYRVTGLTEEGKRTRRLYWTAVV
ncbi:MAG: hypothetical protein C4295_07260 [Candidatus Fervidibacterota bacterium]